MERLRAQSAAKLETERKRVASSDSPFSLAATVRSLEAELLAERKRLLGALDEQRAAVLDASAQAKQHAVALVAARC